ncbi:MAG TPA: helix-turn-helix domain-containing protein [Puia sp.]|jgi:AraC-like DNA-binding protein
MAEGQIPNYSIDRIKGEDHTPQELIATRFGEYLHTRNYLFQPHRHSFYHLVYFTKGEGTHSIDFVNFPVVRGQIYFMSPGQVHHWAFSGDVDGYIVNFSPRLFQLFLASPDHLERFSFFGGPATGQVVDLSVPAQLQVSELFEKILDEVRNRKEMSTDMILTLLLQIFILVDRILVAGRPESDPVPRPSRLILKNFRKLVEENYMKIKLPREYAALLYVTPNYLNSLCQDVLGTPAGEIIRERVILEAKRLLVNASLSITEIAYRLNFQDNSYFSRFFKKHTGNTPEEFRKQYHIISINQ